MSHIPGMAKVLLWDSVDDDEAWRPGGGYTDQRGFSASFAEPLATLPGWVAVLHFARNAQSGTVDLVEVSMTYVDGALTSNEFGNWLRDRLRAVPPPRSAHGAITARMMRLLEAGGLQERARAEMTSGVVGAALPGDWSRLARLRSGPRRKDDTHYATLAARYVELLASGAMDPVARISEEQYVSKSTVRNQLSEARRRDLLTSVGRGRVGGQLTDRAMGLLESTTEGNA